MTDRQLLEIQVWVGVAAVFINAVSFVALVIYVVKTWHIASATQESAAATRMAATATQRSTEISQAVLEEMREARESEAAPYVVAYFDFAGSSPIVSLVVTNVGKLPAKNIRLEFDPPIAIKLSPDSDTPLPKFLVEPIPFLPPQLVLKTLFGSGPVLFGSEDIPKKHAVTIDFEDAETSKKYRHSYILDIDSFRGRMYTTERSLNDIYNVLDTLTKQLARRL